jgi:hypothetical protein
MLEGGGALGGIWGALGWEKKRKLGRCSDTVRDSKSEFGYEHVRNLFKYRKKKPNMNRQIELESYGIHVTWLKLCFSKEISSANITVSKKTVILAWKHRLLRGVKQRLTCRSAYYTEWEH